MRNKPVPKGYYEKKLKDALVGNMETKMVKQLLDRESTIGDNDLAHELTSSKSRYYKNWSEITLKAKTYQDESGKLSIKGKDINLKLSVGKHDVSTMVEITRLFS